MTFKKMMVAAALMSLAACGGEDQPEERIELGGEQGRESARANWAPEFTARLDSANAAYAAGDYETARAVFTELTEEEPDLGVVWFGLYMAENALGNEEAAAEAMARVEELSPGLGPMHDMATDTTGQAPMPMEGHPPMMPQGHPPMDSGAMDGASGTPMQQDGQ